jgi:hypothetical protein
MMEQHVMRSELAVSHSRYVDDACERQFSKRSGVTCPLLAQSGPEQIGYVMSLVGD